MSAMIEASGLWDSNSNGPRGRVTLFSRTEKIIPKKNQSHFQSHGKFMDGSWRKALFSLLLLHHHQTRPIEATGSNHNVNDDDLFILDESIDNYHHFLDADLPTFELHPTSVLGVEKQRRKLLLQQNNNNGVTYNRDNNHQTIMDTTTTDWMELMQKDWFHPNSNAIYATIPKKEDLLLHNNNNNNNNYNNNETHSTNWYEQDEMLHDFHRYRHLSRYERQYRLQNDLDLQPHWDGIYNFDAHDDDNNNNNEEHDAEMHPETNMHPTTTTTTTTTNSHHDMNATTSARMLLQDSFTTLVGGRLNNYQAVALSQGYGTHYANAWVGSPTPQRKTLIVDTGSHYTAFPCTGCKNCGLQHHTDPYFNPEKSQTFHALNCHECREGVTCQTDKCVFSQSYTEGSSWEAYQVSDRFYSGGNDFLGAVDPNDQKYVIDFMFGCQLSLNGLFISQLADGIIGMSMYDTTLTKQMYNKGKLEHNIFALCYRRELGSSKRGVSAGSMTLGGVSNSLDTSPIIYAKNMATIGFYTVYVKSIYIRAGGGQSAKTPKEGKYLIHKVPLNVHKVNSGKGVIVDSGTTDTYLNKNMARSFNKMWKKVTGRDYAHAPISLDDEQLRSLPTILVQCQAYDMRRDPSLRDPDQIVGYAGNLDPSSPTDLLIAIPATNYMEFSPRTKQYASRVYFTETSGGVLGSNTMQGHNVVFDWENGRIGFAESSCTYDRKNAPKESEEGRYSDDCSLGRPVLSQTCIQTVDEQICDNNPSNLALLGNETWTMVVEHPGTESGMSCVEVATKRSPFSELGPSMITCEGDGFCTELRLCQLPCSKLQEAKNVIPVSASKFGGRGEKNCGDTSWGSCDFRCNQSRIESMPFSDGQCHEANRTTRLCHKDACGRSDPCRVPFIVHAIYVFRGVRSSNWTKREDDVLSTALAAAFLALSDQVLFGVGDVKTVLTRPWVARDDTEYIISAEYEDSEDELGTKVVVQISIYNPSAEDKTVAESSAPPKRSATSNIGEMVKNITDSLRSSQASTTACKDSDLFELAKDARVIAFGIPEHPSFMAQLLGNIHSVLVERRELDDSAFSPLFQDTYLALQSRLLSSWTIRTDVDDEINYFGPPEPLVFSLLRYVHRIALVTFCFSLFVFLWGLAVQALDFLVHAFNSGRVWLPGARGTNPEYAHLETNQENGEAVKHMEEGKRSGIFEKSSIRRRFSIGRHKSDSTLGDNTLSKAVELTVLKAGLVTEHRSPPPKKRRSSGTENDRHHMSHQSSV